MMNAVVHERVSCGDNSRARVRAERSESEASVSMAFGCFACGGRLSVRTGNFQRCTSCRAENYCPLTDVPVEERVRRWWQRARSCTATSVAVYGPSAKREERGASLQP